jgi:hypothetical protein
LQKSCSGEKEKQDKKTEEIALIDRILTKLSKHTKLDKEDLMNKLLSTNDLDSSKNGDDDEDDDDDDNVDGTGGDVKIESPRSDSEGRILSELKPTSSVTKKSVVYSTGKSQENP